MPCEQPDHDRLAAWIDGQLPDEEAAAVAAHLRGCAACRAAAADRRAYRQRMAAFAAAAPSLPAGFWEKVQAGLDRVDAPPPTAPTAPAAAHPTWPWWGAAVGLLVTLGSFIYFATRPAPVVVPVAALAGAAATTPLPPGGAMLATRDPDRAARWLGEQLGAAFPAVSLSLVGARLEAARADRAARRAGLRYRMASGQPVALLIYLAPNATLPPLRSARHSGSSYQVAEERSGSAAAWQVDGRTYVAIAPLPLPELLPYAREMDRHCRRR
jgi:anti-sigma factor RsiW